MASIGQAIIRWVGLAHKWVWPEISSGTASISFVHLVVVTTTLTGPQQAELEHKASNFETSVAKLFCKFSKSSSTFQKTILSYSENFQLVVHVYMYVLYVSSVCMYSMYVFVGRS